MGAGFILVLLFYAAVASRLLRLRAVVQSDLRVSVLHTFFFFVLVWFDGSLLA